jgi:hypothetical protein
MYPPTLEVERVFFCAFMPNEKKGLAKVMES